MLRARDGRLAIAGVRIGSERMKRAVLPASEAFGLMRYCFRGAPGKRCGMRCTGLKRHPKTWRWT